MPSYKPLTVNERAQIWRPKPVTLSFYEKGVYWSYRSGDGMRRITSSYLTRYSNDPPSREDVEMAVGVAFAQALDSQLARKRAAETAKIPGR